MRSNVIYDEKRKYLDIYLSLHMYLHPMQEFVSLFFF